MTRALVLNFSIKSTTQFLISLTHRTSRRNYTFLLTLLLYSFALQGLAQKQLLLLRNEEVILRLNPGDEFIYRLKNSKEVETSYVNNIFDDAVLAHNDTVPFHLIDKIYFQQTKFYNRIGIQLAGFGALLFLGDLVNVTLIQDEPYHPDNWVSAVSITSMAIGLPLALIRKKSQKINYKHRLLMVKRGSMFYEEDVRDAEFLLGR